MSVTVSDYREGLERAIASGIEPNAVEVDRSGGFPRLGIDALAENGLLGLISASEVGGQGRGLREAADAVEKVARSCGSTAMVLCMHYAGTAVIEALGPQETRQAIAQGRHLTTLA